MLKYKKGCLIKAALNNEIDAIVHGCNCFGAMSAGVAKTIKATFPSAFEIDKLTKKGDRNKLGTISIAHQHGVIVVNAYTQYTHWDKNDMLSYEAIRECFITTKQYYGHLRIGIPKIGCGLAHGQWDRVKDIIEEVMRDDVDITVYTI